MAEMPDFESTPLTRAEYIQTVIHLYRAEMQRASVWRQRLDATTNWAIVVTVTAVSYTFSSLEHPHVILLVGNLIIFTLLWVEARRYRYYDVWRTRLRKIEENFFAPILRRDLASPQERWGVQVAEDFVHPTFKIPFLHALSMRLRRNYLMLFLITLAAWGIKVLTVADSLSAGTPTGVHLYRAVGYHLIPPAAMLIIQSLFYLALLVLAIGAPRAYPYSGEIHEITPEKVFWDR
jgi:uncharacterized membrane protein